VTDYRELNKQVIRTIHPFPSAADLVKRIHPTSRYFAKIDAIHGYFQVPLDEDSSRLTTFLLPSGRFRYLGAPMGLNTSSDEFCCRTDQAVAGLQGWLLKIVDDMLVQAPDMPTLWARLQEVLLRCREHGIKISYEKLEVGTSMKFAGFIISGAGVRPNSEKLSAVADFPTPTNTTELRGFLGLVNQLGIFIPDIAHMSALMRTLLKKGVAYTWLECHAAEFEKIKAVLTSPMVVQPFDPALETELLTDASRLYGIGFALIQHDYSGRLRLISCGSRSVTKCQQNYATIEQECMAIKWGIEKCEYYLKGIPSFTVVTDHKPLIGIF
jgi:phospholipid-translocating ATPase